MVNLLDECEDYFFCMVTCIRKSTWENLLVVWRILHLFVGSSIDHMVSKNPPRYWYENTDNFLIILYFHHCHYDPTVYTKKKGIDLLIMVLYVDDFLLMGSSSSMIQSIQQELMEQYDMIYLGILHFFLVCRSFNIHNRSPFLVEVCT
jgi:hypothetical protein